MTSPFDAEMLRVAIAMLTGAAVGHTLGRLGCTWPETIIAAAAMIALSAFVVALVRAFQL